MARFGYALKKTGKMFLDFMNRVDQKYDSKGIKCIFLALDNVSTYLGQTR